MTYNELQDSFDVEHGIFSADAEGVDWDGDWDGDFARDIRNDVAAEGDLLLHYNGVTSKGPITNPTWGQIMEFFSHAIENSGDYHHVFLEGFEEDGGVLELYSGS